MKIGIVCYPTYGGSGVVATELGLGLARKGHEVHFITYKRPARLSAFHENVVFHEVATEDYPLFEYTPYDTSLASKLVDVVKFAHLDLLHVHYAIPHAAVAYMAKKILLTEGKYIPVITTLHGTDITLVGNNNAFAPVVAFSINKSDGVTAVSESLKQQTYEYFDIHNDIRVINNFIDFERFRKVNKDHFKKAIAPNGERILVHVSNFRKVKRVEDVLKVFAKVYKEIPSKLLLIGDGPERHNLEELCRKMELCHETRFLGKQDAVEELLAIADLFIMPSGSESFGLAALEAMACEVPVISSDVGGLPEVNIHGKTGYLSPVGDVEDMARNALSILQDDKKLQTFRRHALAQAKRFDIDNILPQYEAYYEEIVKTAVY
ncbi:N-acetyl-alpha-D-glucosaminyl L-malate synthase BshA [Phaeodactylibacter xiamenensis]|jgi:N-acetyl-alpha-D-glucosaminyl L-malate synthase BshA|uniref:N-acetyl-alpha-D-glucosaminyl L-malate synthase n=1 Tax=Phaeodactylibacter xiamenensis TaxID=1524460 RepID=A0A098S6Y9_9BACT|nr:N-acetyl-alpha-D-glucosaminyl L-malate synthase BshA [Phaeodactylibacter xiamenensis]KGE87860.1 N-acetyl-alpha-D-glucosaminyl L-malate synthase [Phaeodactylibacter xiamenensis]MCR9051890.1 N-acetyl-alpha-D-glucosaminyl L-malate synthase BshA [bacterium]